MASYYNQVEEAIQKNEQELSRLQEDLKGIKSVEKDTPPELYQRQYAQLLYHMAQEQKMLEENRNLLKNYDSAHANISSLRELRDLRDKENYHQVISELDEEIARKEKEVSTSIGLLTDELAQELRNSFLQESSQNTPSKVDENTIADEKTESDLTSKNNTNGNINENEEKLSKAEENHQELQAEYQTSIDGMKKIFAEERAKKEEGPFQTEEELDRIENEYMQRKIEENEKITKAKKTLDESTRKVERLKEETDLDKITQETSEKYGISVEDYKKIRTIVEKKEILSAIYEKKGLGEFNRRLAAGRKKARDLATEVVERIIQQTKEKTTTTGKDEPIKINIIDEINSIYETDIKTKSNSKVTTITLGEPIKTKEDQKVKVNLKSKKNEVIPTSAPDTSVEKARNATRIESGKELIPVIAADDSSKKTTGKNSSVTRTEPGKELIPVNGTDNSAEKEPVNIIARGFNPDGTYRLLKEDIIQDEVDRKQKVPEKKPDTNNRGVTPPVSTPPKNNIPKNTPSAQPPKQVPTVPKKNAPKRGLLTIMDELTSGLKITKKDGKRYKASNIKVADSFKKELKSGNYLYNIVHFVPAIVKLPFNLLKKATGKIMFRDDSKKNIKKLKQRIAKLSEEDLMTIYTEYRGNRVMQERFPSIINTLLDERIQQFAFEKVTGINSELEQRYQNAFHSIKQLEAIDSVLRDPNRSQQEKDNLRKYRANLIKGQTENISAIRNGYQAANEWLSGGAHGFSEDMKAATTKLSCVGKRFAKDYDLDGELLHKQAQLERAERQAIADGNDEMALRIFVQAESLLSSNTEISNSVMGKRSTGKKYYSPLVEQLDYRDDPFVRDLFTTVALTSAAISAAKAIATQAGHGSVIAKNQEIIDKNNQTLDQVNQIGKDIAGKRQAMMEGMEAQSIQDTLTAGNTIEREALNSTNWSINSRAYRLADDTGHAYYNDLYDATQTSIQDVATKYASGAITQQQAMDLIADISTQTQTTLGKITEECLDIFIPYAKTHPQFDLTGIQGAMEYITKNSTAITNMNQAMVDVTAAGDVLAGLQLEKLAPLTGLPAEISAPLFTAAASVALATNVTNTMTDGVKRGKYGNNVTTMVEDYVLSQNQSTTKEKQASR